MKYGLDLTLNEIDSDADCAAVVDRFLPGLRDKLGQNPQARGLSLRKLAQYTGGLIPQQALDALDKALQELGRSAGGYTAAEKAKILRYSQILEQEGARKGCGAESVRMGKCRTEAADPRKTSPERNRTRQTVPRYRRETDSGARRRDFP